MYEETPIFIPVDITEDVIKLVAHKRLGGAGPSGMESEALQVWLIKFRDDSKKIVLVLKLLWTSWPIRSHIGTPNGK